MGEHRRPAFLQVLDIPQHPLAPTEEPVQPRLALDQGAPPPVLQFGIDVRNGTKEPILGLARGGQQTDSRETGYEKTPPKHHHSRSTICLPNGCERSVRSCHRCGHRRRYWSGRWWPAGAAVGAGVGAVAGGLSDANRPKFRQYVTTQKRPSYAYKEKVVVGAKLPSSGVTYYEVPQEYGVTKYRYTVVNERPVLVDPGTHTIVEVIE